MEGVGAGRNYLPNMAAKLGIHRAPAGDAREVDKQVGEVVEKFGEAKGELASLTARCEALVRGHRVLAAGAECARDEPRQRRWHEQRGVQWLRR